MAKSGIRRNFAVHKIHCFMDTKYIFVTGGVVSSLGKGIISASIGKLLQARGYKVTIQKFDPYINIDPGTLNPYEHGECYVTEDGFETDLDLGHYERFTGIHTTRNNSITTGRIYKTVIDRERHGDYLGKTIQVVPHITDEIKRRMLRQSEELRVKNLLPPKKIWTSSLLKWEEPLVTLRVHRSWRLSDNCGGNWGAMPYVCI